MTKAIGIMDSGLGGFTVFHALEKRYPQQQFIFVADQARAPYGDRLPDEIYQSSARIIQWFQAQSIMEVLIACNTISSTCLDELRAAFPAMTIIGIIDLTVSQFKASDLDKVGLIATQATVNTHLYAEKIKAIQQQCTVIERATPQLVPLIESLADPEEILEALELPMRELNLHTNSLILGCTHYPLIKGLIETVYHHPIYSSIDPIVRYYQHHSFVDGVSELYTTKDAKCLHDQLQMLYHEDREIRLLEI